MRSCNSPDVLSRQVYLVPVDAASFHENANAKVNPELLANHCGYMASRINDETKDFGITNRFLFIGDIAYSGLADLLKVPCVATVIAMQLLSNEDSVSHLNPK